MPLWKNRDKWRVQAALGPQGGDSPDPGWTYPIEDSGSFRVIDPDGYRPNVGIVLIRDDGRVFWARRVNRDGWQFPQGGMRTDETPLEAMYRELEEETGLQPEHVEVLGATPGWLRYRLPNRYVRHHVRPTCVGQKQVWFLLRFMGEEAHFRLDANEKPEFDLWRWVDFWYPSEHVVSFKRRVYEQALKHLLPMAEALCQTPLRNTYRDDPAASEPAFSR